MLTTFSGRCVLRGAENKIFFLVYKVIHKSNSFQTCSQSFNKIICWQKFYLPFKGSSQSATTLQDLFTLSSPETNLVEQIWLTSQIFMDD